MAIQRFKDIVAWQKAQIFAVEIHKAFNSINDPGFKDQIVRNAISISNNIAEGFEMGSSFDFIKSLHACLGTCYVIQSMLHLSENLGYIDQETHFELSEMTNGMAKTLKNLIESLNPKP